MMQTILVTSGGDDFQKMLNRALSTIKGPSQVFMDIRYSTTTIGGSALHSAIIIYKVYE